MAYPAPERIRDVQAALLPPKGQDMANSPRPRGRPRLDPAKPDTNTVQALDRALGLLDLIAQNPGKTLSELAVLADLAVASVFRALVTLQARGMVEAEGPAQVWHIGSGAFRIGNAFLHRTNIVERARRPMDRLMQETGETVSLGILNGDQALVLAQVESLAPVRTYFASGSTMALHASALGKALIAWKDDEIIEEILSRSGLARQTSLTLSSPESLLRDLSRTQARGFALDDQEQAEGMRAVAAPVFDAFGAPVAAIAITGPAIRLGLSDATRFGALVRDVADQVTLATGGARP